MSAFTPDNSPDQCVGSEMGRNYDVVLQSLRRCLPERGARLLEVASGDGKACAVWARAQPMWRFQPSDRDPGLLAEIRSSCRGITNVRPPVVLDAEMDATKWPVDAQSIDAVCAINLCHVASEEATHGLFSGASRILRPGGTLCLYGPFRSHAPLSLLGRGFDAMLRMRDPQAGLKELQDLLSDGRLGDMAMRAIAMDRVHGDHYCCLWTRQADAAVRIAHAKS